MAEVNPYIPLQAGHPSGPFGPDITKQIQMEDLLLRLQQNREAIEARNALKSLYGNSSNIDAATGLPKPSTFPRIGQIDPQTAMDLSQSYRAAQSLITKTRLLADKNYKDQLWNVVQDTSLPALDVYRESVAKGDTAQEALRKAQAVYREGYDRARNDPNLAPEIRDHLVGQFDPDRAQRNLLHFEEYRKELREQRAERQSELSNYKLTTEETPGGTKRQIFVAPGKPALDVAGNPVTPTGMPAGSKEDKPDYVANIVSPDGKTQNDVPLLYGNQGFVDARSRQPVPIDQLRNIRRMGSGAQASPEAIDATAELIANYQQPPLSSYAMKSGNGPAIMARVQQINPNYSASKYQAAARTRTAFDVGRQGDQVRSLNVAIQHLDVFDDLGKALKNRDQLAVNRVLNYVQTELGHPEVKNFDTAKQIIGDEVIKSVVGSGAALSDREGLQRQFNSASSPAQLQQVAATLKRLMAGQLNGLRRQFTAAGLPADEFNEKLEPDTVKALEGGGTARSGSATGKVTLGNDATENQRRMAAAPPGTVFVFPDGSELTKPGAKP